jgi:flagellar FliJ protein
MKKFTFTLEPLARVKDSAKTQQELLLARAQQALDRLTEQMERQRERLRAHDREFRAQMEAGMNGQKLREFNNFKTYLIEFIEQLAINIERATEERDACRDALIETMKEIRTLEKLREKQYRLYLEEVRREEEKAIGDFVAFQVTNA